MKDRKIDKTKIAAELRDARERALRVAKEADILMRDVEGSEIEKSGDLASFGLSRKISDVLQVCYKTEHKLSDIMAAVWLIEDEWCGREAEADESEEGKYLKGIAKDIAASFYRGSDEN